MPDEFERTLLILIDTSALHSDPTLNRPFGRLLLAAARSDEVVLVLPEIVVLEAVNLFRERLEQASRSIRKAQRELQSLGVDFAPELPNDGTVDAYEQTLRARLAEPEHVSRSRPTSPTSISPCGRLPNESPSMGRAAATATR